MPTSVTMPQLGESVTEGTVTRWLKAEGEEVTADEPLLEVSTDKVDTEIPAPASGVLTKIVVAEDETVAVGAELAVIGGADEGSGDAAPAEQSGGAGESDEAPAQDETAGDQSAEDEQPAADASAAEQPAEDEQPAAEQSAPAEQAEPAASESGSGDSGDSAGGTSVTMPALGESVTEGTVTRWLKAEGDEVSADEPLLEVSTDKVDTEIPSPVSGTLTKIVVAEDETVAVGAELAVIGGASGGSSSEQAGTEEPAAEPEAAEPAPAPAEDQDSAPDAEPPAKETAPTEAEEPAQESAPAEPAPTDQPPAKATEQAPASTGPSHAAPAPADGATYVTPLVRKLAAEKSVELAGLTGTGVGGRIRKQDVLAAADSAATPDTGTADTTETTPAATSAPEPAGTEPAGTDAPAAAKAAPAASALRGRTEKLTRLRALIARRMVESLQVSAQLTTVVEVDLTRVARLRDRVKAEFLERQGVKLSYLPFLAVATVEALRSHPMVNSSIDIEAGTVTYHDSENLGIAVDTERGLLVPVIHQAGDLNLGGIARKIADLAERTRTNKVLPDELGGGTFTLTNTGSRGALFDTPIINQPQVAILGTGSVVKRAVVVDDPELGEIVTVRSMMYLALSYDHRIVDGADAARFLTTMKDRLEAGEFESALGLS